MHDSSTDESLYEYEDANGKDKHTTGTEAVNNANKKHKNAAKIQQMNEMLEQSDKNTPLINYLGATIKKGIAPKSMGFVHRKDKPDQLNVQNAYLRDDYVDAICKGLFNAPVLREVSFRNCALNDERGLRLLGALNLNQVESLDISYNPHLSTEFYKQLNLVNANCDAVLRKLQLEGNKIGDDNIAKLVKSLVFSNRIYYLNVSDNEITDFGARNLAILLCECDTIRVLFVHYNRIMGRGGGEIARAIQHKDLLQVLDISYNAIGGGGKKTVSYAARNESKYPEEDEYLR